MLRRKSHKNHRKAGAGKLLWGLLIGSVLGGTVGWLTAPGAGDELRRKLQGDMGARERARTADGNVESQARELVETVSEIPPAVSR
jgi:gas vesicle protein